MERNTFDLNTARSKPLRMYAKQTPCTYMYKCNYVHTCICVTRKCHLVNITLVLSYYCDINHHFFHLSLDSNQHEILTIAIFLHCSEKSETRTCVYRCVQVLQFEGFKDEHRTCEDEFPL